MKGFCEACDKYGLVDKAHVKSRGSGGSMDDDNIILLCRSDHILQHSLGWKRFCNIHLNVKDILKNKGWMITVEGKLRKI